MIIYQIFRFISIILVANLFICCKQKLKLLDQFYLNSSNKYITKESGKKKKIKKNSITKIKKNKKLLKEKKIFFKKHKNSSIKINNNKSGNTKKQLLKNYSCNKQFICNKYNTANNTISSSNTINANNSKSTNKTNLLVATKPTKSKLEKANLKNVLMYIFKSYAYAYSSKKIILKKVNIDYENEKNITKKILKKFLAYFLNLQIKPKKKIRHKPVIKYDSRIINFFKEFTVYKKNFKDQLRLKTFLFSFSNKNSYTQMFVFPCIQSDITFLNNPFKISKPNFKKIGFKQSCCLYGYRLLKNNTKECVKLATFHFDNFGGFSRLIRKKKEEEHLNFLTKRASYLKFKSLKINYILSPFKLQGFMLKFFPKNTKIKDQYIIDNSEEKNDLGFKVLLPNCLFNLVPSNGKLFKYKILQRSKFNLYHFWKESKTL